MLFYPEHLFVFQLIIYNLLWSSSHEFFITKLLFNRDKETFQILQFFFCFGFSSPKSRFSLNGIEHSTAPTRNVKLGLSVLCIMNLRNISQFLITASFSELRNISINLNFFSWRNTFALTVVSYS